MQHFFFGGGCITPPHPCPGDGPGLSKHIDHTHVIDCISDIATNETFNDCISDIATNDTFNCNNGVIVYSSAVCNGIDDCFNSLDEQNCGEFALRQEVKFLPIRIIMLVGPVYAFYKTTNFISQWTLFSQEQLSCWYKTLIS